MKTTKNLFIHLGSTAYAKEGTIHLLASPADYKELEAFFSSHFNTLSYTHDGIGFPEQLFKCPKGTMFMRDDKGELIPSLDEK